MSAILKNRFHDSLRALDNRAPIRDAHDFRKEFICPEESGRYAGSLEQLVLKPVRNTVPSPVIIEFGSGTGTPVISAILNSKFHGVIHGYEISFEAATSAEKIIAACGLDKQYIIHNTSFFETARIPAADYLIANPPYIPCDDRDLLLLPGLCGGAEGNDISKKLLSRGYENVFLEVSSYSNPIGLIDHARSLGYIIADFQITQMPFGIYSRQDIVWQRINDMRKDGKAFFSDNCYLVGSAFFTKSGGKADLSAEFLNCLTAMGRS